MYETKSELNELQNTLDRSADKAGLHIRSLFKPEHRLSALSAQQVVRFFQGVKEVAAATVNSRREPRVAPIDAVFYHGRFHLSTERNSLRARHITTNPGVSLTYFEGADPVIIVHGRGSFVRRNHSDFNKLDSEWVKAYGTSTTALSRGVLFVRVEPETMFAYAFHPKRFSD